MANRILKPKGPYEAPEGFQPGSVPISAVAYNPETPETEIVDKDVQFVHPCSKSTFNKPTGYHDPDSCGNEYYTKANVASSINQIVDCGIVSIFQGSLSVTVARDVTKTEFDDLVDSLTEALWVKIQAIAPVD